MAVSNTQQVEEETATASGSFDTGSGSVDGVVGSNKAVVELEKSLNKATIGFALLIIDKFFEDRPYARFYALETVARVPYFGRGVCVCRPAPVPPTVSYLVLKVRSVKATLSWGAFASRRSRSFTRISRAAAERVVYVAAQLTLHAAFLSVLHAYETIGWWRRADYLKVHFAQTMNEFHHLLIMESLGGDEKFADRFLAQHMAVFYFFISVTQYLISPRMAYNLSEQVEEHAFHTYDEFLAENEADLKARPPPSVAVQYYTKGDLYLFDEFQTTGKEIRRPTIENLYDVFVNVRNDEAEHMKTMQFCQQPGSVLRSPHDTEACELLFDASGAIDEVPAACTGNDEGDSRVCEGVLDCALTEFSGTPRKDRKRGPAADANGSADAGAGLETREKQQQEVNNAVELKRTGGAGEEEEEGSEADEMQAV